MTGVVEYRAPDQASGYEWVWKVHSPRTPLGATVDLTLETLFPTGFRFPTGWFVVLDGKGVGTPGWNGPAPFNLDCTEGHWSLRIKGAGTPGATNTAPMASYVQTDFPLGPAKTGAVDQIRIRMKLAVTDGNVLVERNGQQVAAKTSFPTTYTGTVDREWWVGGYTDGNRNPGWGPFRSMLHVDGAPANLHDGSRSPGATATVVATDWNGQTPPEPEPEPEPPDGPGPIQAKLIEGYHLTLQSQLYKTWARDNPGEASKVASYWRANGTPPALRSLTGRSMVAYGEAAWMAAREGL